MQTQELKKIANNIRKSIIEGTYQAKSGHPGGSLSAADLLAVLYFDTMNYDKDMVDDPDRDRFVLSKGHAAPALYGVLAEKEIIPKEEIKSLRHVGSRLQGHPSMKELDGVEISTGSLGQGISAAVGIALAGKLDEKDYHVYALLGDGETEEGQVWEAAMFAGNNNLDNLTLFVDLNNLQIDGTLDEVNSPLPLDEKFKSFNFNVIVVDDGNDIDQLKQAIDQALNYKGKPTAVIMQTIKGKGVSFMEGEVDWHGKGPNEEEYKKAMKELEEAGEKL